MNVSTASCDDSTARYTPAKGSRGVPAAVLVTACAAAVAALVGVRGDFPLSDDWSYAYAARALCETGRIELLPWTGASLVVQAWYGALLCKLFGLSFTVLRISTLVLATAGVIGLWSLLRELRVPTATAVLVTVACGLSPLYVNLSFTFMTDVPFAALTVIAAYAYVRGLREAHVGPLLVASIVCAAALLVRQHGIFLAAAASLAALLDARRPLPTRARTALASSAAPALALLVYLVWLYALHGAPSAVGNKLAEAAHASLFAVANITFRAVESIGFLLLPLAVAAVPAVFERARATFVAVLSVLATGALVLYLREGTSMFYLTNVLYDFGLGALSLRDVLFLGFPPPEHVGTPLAIVLTASSTLSAAVLVAAASLAWPPRTDPARMFITLAAALLFLGSLLHAGFYFDRYLIPILPFVAITLAAGRLELRIGPASWLLASALAWYAVAGTHDYMAWNRARFAMLNDLESAGTDPRSIDGGVEYNGWRLAHDLGTWPTTEEARPGQPATKRSWWWVVDDRYVVTFRSLEGYALKSQQQYRKWLMPGSGRVLLLERNESLQR